jgi:aspartate aminotransferase
MSGGNAARAPELAARMGGLAAESAFQVLAAANRLEAAGRSVIHFEIGEPDFPTPPRVVEAAKQALDAGRTTYCQAQGIPALREAVARHALRYKGIRAEPEQVVVAPGAKPIIFSTLCALVNPGDEVLYPDPGFPTYESVIRFVGGTPVPLTLREENGFRLDTSELRARLSSRTRLLILNSPSNPTGSFLDHEDLGDIAASLASTDAWVLSDEIYSRIVYEGTAASIATQPGMRERTVILDGFSKTYSMTGWRLGYGIMPPGLAEAMTRLLINSNSCTTHFVQLAGIQALDGPQDSVSAMVEEFRGRRDAIVEGLNTIPGFRCARPAGAFYAFPNVTGTGMESRELAAHLLEDAGVAVLDGAAFGAAGRGYLRLSYATSREKIRAGLERITRFMEKLPPVTPKA